MVPQLLLGVKREQLDRTESPASKKRRIHTQSVGKEEEEVPPNQRNLFDGYTFLLTQRTKEDRHLGKPSSILL